MSGVCSPTCSKKQWFGSSRAALQQLMNINVVGRSLGTASSDGLEGQACWAASSVPTVHQAGSVQRRPSRAVIKLVFTPGGAANPEWY